jgi:hypothetical protein
MTADFPVTPTDAPTPPEHRRRILTDPGSGRYSTGHMATTEVPAAGTDAVITPDVELRGAGFETVTGDGKPGPVTRRLREHLLEIHGRAAEAHGCMRRVL